MKTITPVTVWFNGQEVEASVLSATCMNDNLQNSASFQYQLYQEILNPAPGGLQTVVTGLLNMTGEAYTNWDTNEYAYAWIAEQLNLTITGEWTPPVPPTPTV